MNLVFPFPLGTLLHKFRTNPSTIFLVTVVTDRPTDRQTQTNASKNILPRFRGENDNQCLQHFTWTAKANYEL